MIIKIKINNYNDDNDDDVVSSNLARKSAQ